MKAAIRKSHMTTFERFWLSFDNMYMKYWFGGVIAEEFSIYREPITATDAAELHDGAEADTETDEEEEKAIQTVLIEHHFYADGMVPESHSVETELHVVSRAIREDKDYVQGEVQAFNFETDK